MESTFKPPCFNYVINLLDSLHREWIIQSRIPIAFAPNESHTKDGTGVPKCLKKASTTYSRAEILETSLIVPLLIFLPFSTHPPIPSRNSCLLSQLPGHCQPVHSHPWKEIEGMFAKCERAAHAPVCFTNYIAYEN